MLLDDAGMWNQYMVRHRIAVRADANIVLELTSLLKGYVSDYLRRLQAKARGVDPYAENTQKFMGDWHTLLEDFENFAGQVVLADALELRAIWENRDYWEQRCDALPEIPPPTKYPAPPQPTEEGDKEKDPEGSPPGPPPAPPAAPARPPPAGSRSRSSLGSMYG